MRREYRKKPIKMSAYSAHFYWLDMTRVFFARVGAGSEKVWGV